MRKLFCFIILFILFLQAIAQENKLPLFKIGVVADVQYADIDKAGNRDYRNSLLRLENCIDIFNKQDLAFIINLGDLIDRDYHNFERPLKILKKSDAKVHQVIGNHEFSVDDKYKKSVKGKLKNKRGYYDFKIGNFVFIILDGTDVSTFAAKEGSPQYQKALAKYEEVKAKGANNAYTWNGGIGEKQINWLKKRLWRAEQSNQNVILFCHWPLLPENGTQLWNNREVLGLINNYSCVFSWISGHHHAGNYIKAGGIRHLTLKGIVEAKSETSCGILEVYPDQLMLIGYGDQKSQVLD